MTISIQKTVIEVYRHKSGQREVLKYFVARDGRDAPKGWHVVAFETYYGCSGHVAFATVEEARREWAKRRTELARCGFTDRVTYS